MKSPDSFFFRSAKVVAAHCVSGTLPNDGDQRATFGEAAAAARITAASSFGLESIGTAGAWPAPSLRDQAIGVVGANADCRR